MSQQKTILKTILITGSTDGIGLEAAKLLLALGHRVLLHGRNLSKLDKIKGELSALADDRSVEGFRADLSVFAEVETLAKVVSDRLDTLDVLINNAGVFSVSNPLTPEGLDLRFVVNTIAPYQLMRHLLPHLGRTGRVVNLSSAAQSPVDLKALAGQVRLSDGQAYAQSKLALTMWSRAMAMSLQGSGPAIIALNPGSMLGTKMVKTAYGVAGADIGIGAEVLRRAALDDEFANASGQYFDNDAGCFASPHPDALDIHKSEAIVQSIEATLKGFGIVIGTL